MLTSPLFVFVVCLSHECVFSILFVRLKPMPLDSNAIRTASSNLQAFSVCNSLWKILECQKLNAIKSFGLKKICSAIKRMQCTRVISRACISDCIFNLFVRQMVFLFGGTIALFFMVNVRAVSKLNLTIFTHTKFISFFRQ